MENVQGTALELLEQATQEEKVLFDKINRSSDEKVLESFGKPREELLGAFMVTWISRLASA